MQIGIFETEHFEGAYPVIRLFDNGQNKITIFTYQQAYRQFKHLFAEDMHRYEWVVREDNESKYRFILRLYRETKQRKIGLLYMNTVTNNFIFYAWMIRLLKGIRIVVTLHDINNYFHFTPAFSLRRWVRYFGKRSLVKNVREFNVVSETMMPYLESKLPAYKKVHNLPGAVFDAAQYQNEAPAVNGRLNIVIPGSVDGRRRNYETVFTLLDQCRHLPVSITLLGGFAHPYGAAIKARCLTAAAEYPNLVFYGDEVVDQPEFDKVMNEAHLVFIPSVVDTIIADGTKERYGMSISSGNIFDVIKHAKPFIIPVTLKIPDRLAGSAITYTTITEIVTYLEALVQQPDRYQQLLQQAVLNSGEYTIAKVRERNATLFAG
jgi:hypothetical protein